MKIYTFEVQFEDNDVGMEIVTYGVVKLGGAEVYREQVNSHRAYYSSYPGDPEDLKEEVLYNFGLKLGKFLKDI